MEYFPTRHVVGAMAERNITWAEVLWVLEEPAISYASTTGAHAGKNTCIKQRGSLYVVVANSPTFSHHDTEKAHPMYAVITTGLRRTLVWNNTEAANRIKDNLNTEATT